MTYYVVCPRCKGSGRDWQGICPSCGGGGYLTHQGAPREPQASRPKRVNWADLILLGAAILWLVIAILWR